MTESHPEAEQMPVPPAEDPSILGVLNTTDHRRIGKMFMVCSVVLLVASLVVEVLVRLDLTDADGFVVLDASSYAQAFALTRDVLVFGFLVPFFIGAAIFVVPLQVGAGRIAFPRAALLSFWAWAVSVGVLVGAYLINGGPFGGSRGDSDGVDLHMLALGGLILALLLGAITVVTTVFSMRAPGLHMDQVPSFTWASLVTSIGLFLTLPVLLANLTILYVDHRYSTRFDFDFLGGNVGIWEHIEWMYRTPQLFLFIVPVLGVIGEVLPVASGRRVLLPAMTTAAVGAVALFGLGAWAQLGGLEGDKISDGWQGVVYLGMFLGAGLAIMAAVGLNLFTLASSKKLPKTGPALAAIVAALLLMLSVAVSIVGAALDFLESVDAFDIDPDLPLRFTTWSTAQFQLLVLGAGVAGAIAALTWWAPLVFGRKLNAGIGALGSVAALAGALLAAVGTALAGIIAGQPAGPQTNSIYDFLPDANAGFNVIAAIGTIIIAAGAALIVLDLVGSVLMKKGAEAGENPWDGFTPEWETVADDAELPALNSGTPLLDARDEQEVGV